TSLDVLDQTLDSIDGDVEGLCDELARLGLSMKDVDHPCGAAADVVQKEEM
ncbi:hypothetical protein Tco_0944754, partial [Tanacetum coccineum]